MQLQSLRVSSCFAVLAAIGSWQNLHSINFPGSADAVSRNERRFTAIRGALADRLGSRHGQIGYIGDLDPASAPGATARFRAQYSLAPFVFAPAQPYAFLALDPAFLKYRQPAAIPSADPEWFVGDFSASGIAIPEGLVMVRDFGNGVVLPAAATEVIVAALGLISPLLLGYCLLSLLAPEIGPLPRVFLGAGIGAGLVSCCLFVSLASGLPSFTLEILAGIVAAVILARHPRVSTSSKPWTTTDKLLGAAFSCVLIAAIASFLSTQFSAPNGGWDAAAIWNLHARFLATPAWRDAFTPLLLYSHPDYPLLLPAFIARIWRVTGDRTLAAPALAAALFTFATIGVLVSSLTALAGRTQAFAAGILLAGTHFFVAHGASQYADVPVSFFILATMVCLTLAPHLDILVGLAAGLAAWTKNEGWTLIVALAILCIAHREFARRASAMAAGLAPILAIALYFKLTLATPNEFAGGRGFSDLMSMISTPGRYLKIGQGLFASIAGGNFLLPVAGVAVYWLLTTNANGHQSSTGTSAKMCTTLLAIIFAGYWAVLLTSPYRIGWQVDTTLDRLLVQLLPASLFTAFLWRSG